jgi:hypothetical protein
VNKLTRANTDSRKQAVSIRLSRTDVRHVKRLAERLGVRDSDVIRFAIKTMLAKLSPLQDPVVMGRALVPVFVESGGELMRHFDLDATRLASIINDGADDDRRVDHEDIQLIAMSGIQSSYVKLRIAGYRRGSEAGSAVKGPEASGNGHGGAPFGAETEASDESLRQYLYDKYLYASSPEATRRRAAGA